MKALRITIPVLAALLSLSLLLPAQGPIKAGGSQTVARPKQKAEEPKEPELAPIESEFKKDPTAPEALATFDVDATTVTVDVSVVDNDGRFLGNIPHEYFRLTEDKEPQKITDIAQGDDAPLTVALVIEFSNRFQNYLSNTWYDTLQASYGFAQTLGPEDYVAVVAYDLRPEILSDFSNDRNDTAAALSRLRFPGFSESNLYDALVFTAERMQDIEGRKAIVLITTGIDTLSGQNFGQARKAIQNAGVPIYAIGMMQAIRTIMYSYGQLSDSARTDFLMADNQVRTFANESGGMAFFPNFIGEYNGIFATINETLRSQYVLSYQPTNRARDGKFREIKVELIDPQTGKKLKIDVNGKNVKYDIIAKKGYQAPREVE